MRRAPSFPVVLFLTALAAFACSGSPTTAKEPAAEPAEPPATPPPAEAAPATQPAAAPAPTPAPAGELKDDVSASPGINDRYKTPEGRDKSTKIFEDPERTAYQQPDELMKQLAIKKGDIVADVAAGTGYLTKRLSAAVGAKGKIYAEDIVPEFLDQVREKVKKDKLKNVEVVLGTEKETKLPEKCCDLIIVLDAYHHFEYPRPMMDSIKKSLKPGGRLILVEFHKRASTAEFFGKYGVDYKQHIRLDYDGVLAELKQLGWKHVESREFLKYQFFAIFTPM